MHYTHSKTLKWKQGTGYATMNEADISLLKIQYL